VESLLVGLNVVDLGQIAVRLRELSAKIAGTHSSPRRASEGAQRMNATDDEIDEMDLDDLLVMVPGFAVDAEGGANDNT